MPRIARPEVPEVAILRARLRAHLDAKLHTEMDIARGTQVGQPTISKFVRGRIKSITPAVAKVLAYAGINRIDGMERLEVHPVLRSALEAAWNGTEEDAVMLAGLVQALAPIVRSMLSRSRVTGSGMPR